MVLFKSALICATIRWIRRRLIRFGLGKVLAVIILVVLWLLKRLVDSHMELLWPATKVYVSPEDLDLIKDHLFEPEVVSDFPEGQTNKIPQIIHWTYKNVDIPPSFHENVKSFVINNPDWTFYMWTDESSERFVADTHPELLSTFSNYGPHGGNIRRADFIRYVVLYELGGIYVDLDVINYRPLDRLVTKYTCIFPTEPFEHAALRAGAPYLINNAIMLCQPKHPFLRMILDYIPRFAHMEELNDSTGPAFVTSIFMIYNNLSRDNGERAHRKSNSPYFYKGELPEDHEHAVYVPNSQYFCNNVDPKAYYDFHNICYNFKTLSNDLKKRACANLAIKGMFRQRNKFSFLEHQFYRTYGGFRFYNDWAIYINLFFKDIREIVPNLRIY